MKLSDLKQNESAKIIEFFGNERYIKRLNNLGVNIGDIVKLIRVSTLFCPIEIEANGFLLALRKENADLIIVEKV